MILERIQLNVRAHLRTDVLTVLFADLQFTELGIISVESNDDGVVNGVLMWEVSVLAECDLFTVDLNDLGLISPLI